MSADTPDTSTVETPVPSDPSASNDQVAATEKPVQERDEGGRYRNPLQPRIDELTRDKHEARREAEYWRNRATATEAKATPPEPAATKPTADQFDSYDAYVEALTDWKAQERVNQQFAERDQKAEQAKRDEMRQSSWSKSVEAAKAKFSDYDAVMSVSEVPVARHVQELLLDSDMGAELAYHLDRNPDIAQQLNGLSPTHAAREIGRLETRLSASSPEPNDSTDTTPTPPIAAKPKSSAAPPPAKPTVTGRSSSPTLDKMSMDDYVKARKDQGATWARR